MQCFFCNYPVPTAVLEANFCVNCGHPLSQYCPYVPTSERLPLCDVTGRATASCPHCQGLFKACSICRRLHKLDSAHCETADCQGQLREPIEPFPTQYGPLEGTHAVNWHGSLTLAQTPKISNVEALQGLAFRYGLLVGVSQRNIFRFEWNGANWTSGLPKTIVNNAELTLRSLMIERGHAFLLGSDRALVFDLVGDINQLYEIRGVYSLQAVGPRWWTLVGEKGRVEIVDCDTWQKQQIPLDADAGEPLAIVITDYVYLATSKGWIFQIDPATGRVVVLLSESQRWERLAISNGRLAALGYEQGDRHNRLALVMLSTDGQFRQGPRQLEKGSLADFVWAGDRIYVARELDEDQSGSEKALSLLDIYDARQITLTPGNRVLQAGMTTQPGMLALQGATTGNRGEVRLLLNRANSSAQRFFLIDVEAGTQRYIGPYIDRNAPGEPLICIADTRLIVAVRDGGMTKMYTFDVEETQ